MNSTSNSPAADRLQFDAELLDDLFPFHIICDERLQVVQFGPKLPLVIPAIDSGQPLSQTLKILRPSFAPDCASIRKRLAHAFMLESATGARLRGQAIWREREQRLMLLVSPWITDSAEAKRYNISITDLPVHDAAREFMYIVKLQRDAVASAARAYEELQSKKREAELMRDAAVDASRAKSAFLAMMSHEIRTPLNGVIGMLDYLMSGRLDTEPRDCVSVARESALGLLAILNDILDLSKLEAGKMDVIAAPFDLLALLNSLAALFEPQTKAKGISLLVEASAELHPRRSGDGHRIRQILVNLLSNAVKFTDRGEVALRVSADCEHVRFEITDSGVGIPAEQAERLFQPFQQAHAQHTGTGLGLAICKRLASLMGGSIDYSPTPEGGARFVVELSCPALAEPLPLGEGRAVAIDFEGPEADRLAALLTQSAWTINGDNPVIRFTPGSTALGEVRCVPWKAGTTPRRTLPIAPIDQARLRELLSARSSRDARQLAASGGTVLVVDDSTVNQRVATLMLRRLGYAVDVAENGEEGVLAASKRRYDAVLMDMQMPILNGIEATVRIRAGAGPNRETPIMALTANAFESDRIDCLNAGMNGVLTKPLQLKALAEALAAMRPAMADL